MFRISPGETVVLYPTSTVAVGVGDDGLHYISFQLETYLSLRREILLRTSCIPLSPNCCKLMMNSIRITWDHIEMLLTKNAPPLTSLCPLLPYSLRATVFLCLRELSCRQSHNENEDSRARYSFTYLRNTDHVWNLTRHVAIIVRYV